MNLYIWGDKGNIAYGGEALVVMAQNLRTAHQIAMQAEDWSFFIRCSGMKPQDKLGKPDKIIRNRSYAAYFMFSE